MTTLRNRFLSYVISAAPIVLSTPIASFAAEGGSPSKPVAFRASRVEMASIQKTTVPTPASASADEDLTEQKQTLEGEVRYAKAKLDAAQKKLAVQTQAGNLDQADKLNQEIKDWQARLSASKAQLAQVEAEIGGNSSAVQTPGDSEVVLPGETLEIYVVEDPSFNGRYQVRRGGYIILPQVGRISVAGKSLNGAEASVKRALESSQLHRASVMVERIAGADVEAGPLIYLSGEFKNPRPYRIPAGTSPTLVSVILSSGGVADKGDLTRVKVMRMTANKGVVEEVNVQKILDGSGLASDLTLSEGDVITIPAGQSNLIYVTGKVKRQGSYKLVTGERLTAYGAILQSGGFDRFANEHKVHVLRAMPDGTKVKLPVDVIAVEKGLRPDVQLQTNDIVVVPEKFWSF